MTKKHFIAIAAALKFARQEMDEGNTAPKLVIDNLSEDIALICARTNPNFDRSRFLSACTWRA